MTLTMMFYPRDVYVSAVLATATWLAGCMVAGWVSDSLSHTGIVSKWLNLS